MLKAVAAFPDIRTASHFPSGEMPERETLSEALGRVAALENLQAGWNGSDALSPASESVRHALRWLEAQWERCRMEGVRWYAPNITADAEGNVVFEWWAQDRTLSVSFVEAEDGSKSRTAEYLKFGRRAGALAGLREQGAADTAEEAADLMRWFGE